ncbi:MULTISPECIES: SDR family NAD(P)-dependent oxidoreductase [Novosphingobium]|uniref:SDR family NAD(P)-dependent oxidoreductase n=1 Tax=unclassified Novosphingobium TaxID=2644732 RepID=UPI0006C8CE97|nr:MULTISPECIES: SDR family NAD(P)-dependent oxidoreductase [unclassified Novosphingobium]KPH62361.1 alcohol dehydrogenase [Novosphingobium sp. ST904]MPS67746.1 SDR family oxidoreductase [Novosphingobium sp.]TCM43283.1 2-hydroxycyclohexanecarboxyl-CoA dehydrogenase [Novosphingobium sp. ST904]WRT93010.1 SDR family NAD(P)-dependent oxidoreductase [Novosphingobium sp. RL4]
MSYKVAIVTGAAAGIGAACAKRLAREGVAVAVLDLDAERCEDTVRAIREAGGTALALGADVSNRASVKAAVDQVREKLGPISILVNNAGVTDFTPFEELTDERWDFIYAVNVRGLFIMTQECLPDMKAAHWGRIVNISSSSAQTGAINMIPYSSSKGAVVTMTRSMAQEFGPLGITVNNIPPGSVMGTIMSEANRDRFQIPTEVLLQSVPVRRLGEPNDIANACAWLCHEDTGYVTGQTIGVNGGRVVT